jgi:hypothetical protein
MDMKAAPQKQPYRQDAATTPAWMRDPKFARADLDRRQPQETTRVVHTHEDSGDEEPGYGHGV